MSFPDVTGPQLYPDNYSRLNIFAVSPVQPAAGADFTQKVPNGVMWRVVALTGTLTASANAANRLVGFFVKNQDGTVVWQYNLTTALTANLVGNFTFSKDTGNAPTTIATTNHLLMPSPAEPLLAGWTFGTSTVGIDVADAWTAVTMWIQEFLPEPGE